MRGDDTQRAAAGAAEPREARGPRHAAPRRSLLTKLQIPAGKAMAIAAMPTAVFVGMGLTPRLAMADDARDIPFAPGPCVTRSDEPADSASPSPSGSASTTPAPGASDGASDGGKDGSGGVTGGTQPGDTADPKPSTTPSAGEPKPSASGTPAPQTSTAPAQGGGSGGSGSGGGLLGGVVGGLGDLLGGGTKASAPTPTDSASPEPSSTPTAAESKPASDTPVKDTVDKLGGTVDRTVAGVGRTAEGTGDSTEQAIRDAAKKAGAKVDDLGDAAKGLTAKKDGDIPSGADGKDPFPCPTADPKALANAKEEQGVPLLPTDPWKLTSSLLTLTGLNYEGIVQVKTADGKLKPALKFTASSVDIKDLNQTVVYPDGKSAHVESAPGSTSTIRNGRVTMYTEELKGNLFGLIPITFSPQTPPPVNVPFAFFTDAQVTQAGQFGGTLTVPGLKNFITG